MAKDFNEFEDYMSSDKARDAWHEELTRFEEEIAARQKQTGYKPPSRELCVDTRKTLFILSEYHKWVNS